MTTHSEKKTEKLATHLAAMPGLAVDDSETDGWTVRLRSAAYQGSKVVSRQLSNTFVAWGKFWHILQHLAKCNKRNVDIPEI